MDSRERLLAGICILLVAQRRRRAGWLWWRGVFILAGNGALVVTMGEHFVRARSVGWVVGAVAALAVGLLMDDPSGAALGAESAEPVEYNRDIRPILSDRCYQCHGPDAARRKADLRLDEEAPAKAERDGVRAIVPGDLEASELYRRITAKDATERMPPAKSGKSLSSAEIEKLKRWISGGAKWQRHWSFIPPVRPEVPPVRERRGIRNAIDAFIRSRLEREGFKSSREAERGILLRRVTLDLTGLPPTADELDAFEGDESPNAYEKVVDRLLASPRFGERMATRWLSAARYADTNGYQTDAPRVMWRWRDWVIDAFNRNMPFDRFTIEQLAGDMLPGATLDQQIATGFNRNHRGNGEGGIIPEEYAVEYVVDRVDTTATVWLGLTLACARCHSHKFDPIGQEEFYRFFAMFNNVPEEGRALKYGNSPPMIKAPTRVQREELEALEKKVAALESQACARETEIAAAQAEWERAARGYPPVDWSIEENLVVHPSQAECRPGAVLGDVAGFGFYDKFTISVWVKPDDSRGGTILSRMVDEPQGEGFRIVLEQGKLQVNLVKRWLDDAIRVETKDGLAVGAWTHVAVTYDGSRYAKGVKVYLDGKAAAMVVHLDELNQSFFTKEPLRLGSGGGPGSRFGGSLRELYIYSAALPQNELSILATEKTVAEILGIPAKARTAGAARKIRGCFLAKGAPPSIRTLEEKRRAAGRELAEYMEQIPTTMVMQEMAVPRVTHVLERGQYDRPRANVAPGVPRCLTGGEEAPVRDRLGLARWLVSPGQPLAARVAVNRDWQMLFGTGLVKTLDDFGAQGEPPVHPELLDWLAVELESNAWDLKALLRAMVTSATYRQSSRVGRDSLARDQENRLLARGPRLRLSAEMIRDQALALAGLLVERAGGPSVKPYQPAGLWKELADADYVQDHGPSLYRRSLYTFWKRTVPPPAMMAFDAPARETCVVRESRTNTPLQALDVLNDVTFVEAARGFAERLMCAQGGAIEARLAAGFREATARRPRREELAILVDGFRDQLARFRRDRKGAAALIGQGESRPDPRLDAAELAAYTAIAQLILNLDETLTKE
jgi:Protein of unknown function (DUF1553)/Protein of unknown function (DUF1549)/Concanavalin A-like lectin/glucanases superfamily/Planctomycete cytochrome C